MCPALVLVVATACDSQAPITMYAPARVQQGVSSDQLEFAVVWSSTETESTTHFAFGDLDSDGDLDLAVGNANAQSNRVYENTGTALGASAVWSSAERDYSFGVAFGDLDSDGDLDLAVGNSCQINRVYENTGTSLGVTAAWSSSQGNCTVSVAFGDFDSDGDLDLAVGNLNQKNRIYATVDTSLSTVAAWTSVDSRNSRSVAFGDLDSDGDLDLATGNYERDCIYTSTESLIGTICAWSSTENDDTHSVAFGDIDSDGDLDLAVGKDLQGNRVYEYVGTSLGTTAAWSSTETGSSGTAVLGDLDSDGDLDLAVGNNKEDRIYENTGTALGVTAVWSSTETNNSVTAVLGDVDSDGDLDFAVGGYGVSNRVYRNTRMSLGTTAAWSAIEMDFTYAVAFGDLDSDGDLDLAAGNAQQNHIYENTGTSFGVAAVWSSTETDNTSCVAFGDLDSDGDLDLAVGNDGRRNNRAYLNTGTSLAPTAVWSSNATDNTFSVAFGDFGSDGDLDLVVGNDSLTFNAIHENTGTALDPSAAWSSLNDKDDTYSVALGDLGSDGDLDLVVGNHSQKNRIHKTEGAYPWPWVASVWSSAESDITVAVAFGDFDSDGDLDLAVANNSQKNRIYENTGGTSLDVASTWSSTKTDYSYSVAFGDVDSDGDLDLAVGNSNQNNRVYENTGTSLGPTATWSSTETDSTRSVAFGDLDSDGNLDLAVGNYAQSNRVYESAGWGSFGLPNASAPEVAIQGRLGSLEATAIAPGIHSATPLTASPLSVPFVLTDAESNGINHVTLEYSYGGGRWYPATLVGPTTNFASSPGGVAHTVSWAVAVDQVYGDDVIVRLRLIGEDRPGLPFPWQRASLYLTSTSYRIHVDPGPDLDGDGLRGFLDCDDTTAACTSDCSDADADGVPDCNDPCVDVDGDDYGDPGDAACPGGAATDCNDSVASINPGTTDVLCDGVDDDCDGPVDEDYVPVTVCGAALCQAGSIPSSCVFGVELSCIPGAPTEDPEVSCTDLVDNDCDGLTDGGDPDCDGVPCVDGDGDGYGSPGSVNCTVGPALDCDDSNASINPDADDSSCNGVDDNCDSIIDNQYAPDASCGLGFCRDTNTPSSCVGGVESVCQAGTALDSVDITCNNIDDDCDGVIDDDISVDASCGVGFCRDTNTPSSCITGSSTACLPGTPFSGTDTTCDAVDDDCDGTIDDDISVDASCGVGFCRDTNTPSSCIAGSSTACLPGTPLSGTDTTCDAVDDDCDGTIDDDYSIDASCGLGICRDTNTPSSCVGGVESVCQAGTALDSVDITCNNIDDDCDGIIDDDVSVDASCGVGFCRDTNTPSSCIAGSSTACLPGTPFSGTDTTCDAVDDDCDGTIDDDYSVDATCGIGFCRDTNTPSSCVAGSPTACLPGTPISGTDATCDAVDDDCDGVIDDDFSVDAACGVGYCRDTNTPSSCSAGTSTACLPAPPLSGTDTTCDAVDDDCDGTVDDDYSIDVSCGVGFCQTHNSPSSCVAGAESTCMAGSPEQPTELKCNDGIDNDCDGATDMADSDCNCIDADGDGFDTCVSASTNDTDGLAPDCDDGNNVVNPGRAENKMPTCTDGIDNDCDGAVDCSDSKCGITACDVCPADSDGDGYLACGSTPDCDDSASTIHPGQMDATCDGIDDNCNASVDEDYVRDFSCGVGLCLTTTEASSCNSGIETPCAPGLPLEVNEVSCGDGLDNDCDGAADGADLDCIPTCNDLDGDGYGAPGHPTCLGGAALDCDDSQAAIRPGILDVTCDAIDDDCDGSDDDDYMWDDSCGVGICYIFNTVSTCIAGVETACIPGVPTETPEVSCNDGFDNDCDGTIDGSDADCGALCPDNDGDGYGNPGEAACSNGPATDCNDANANINPGVEDATCDGVDDDCDGKPDENYLVDAACGLGVCRSHNVPSSCAEGVETLCVPGSQDEASDLTCDGFDGDCDGVVDEDYMVDSSCGVGWCNGNNTPSSCVGGFESACEAATPFVSADESCNGADDDCDGQTDEEYVVDSSCGTGHCQTSNTPSTCTAGTETACSAGTPLGPTDTSCDGVDDDCDGFDDEDYIVVPSCGIGYCLTNSTPSSCTTGVETACAAASPLSATDESCDGIDDNCDGSFDEEYVIDASCGQGYCQATNLASSCTAGAETPCVAGIPLGVTDATCDNVDGDCDGAVDEDYVADSSCGVGWCNESNSPSNCVGGVETACAGATPLSADDTTCDNLDDDCDGAVDDDYVPDASCGMGYCQTNNTPSSCSNGVDTPCLAAAPAEVPEQSCLDGRDNDCDGLVDGADSDCAGACADTDGDGICNSNDNCLNSVNQDQLDTDSDAEGNVCDADDDNDGILDGADSCPLVVNSGPMTEPIAYAGPDLQSGELALVSLDGFDSCFVTGSRAYSWRQISGPAINASDFAGGNLTFLAPRVYQDEELQFELVVSDDSGASAAVTVRVLVHNTINEAPTADAGADHVVYAGNLVALDGGGSADANGDPLVYQWRQVAGPDINLTDAASLNPTFVAPTVSGSQNIVIELLVRDLPGAVALDALVITVVPISGAPLFISAPELVAMFGESYQYDTNNTLEVGGERPLTYAVSLAPDGFTVDSGGLVNWIPQNEGLYEIAILASNNLGSAEQRFWVSVFAAPVILSTPITSFLLGTPYRYDADGLPEALGSSPIIWSLQSGPLDMTMSAITGELFWTPTDAAPVSVTIAANNAHGEAVQSFLISRSGPTSPYIGPTANILATINQPYPYDADKHVDVVGILPGERLRVLLLTGPTGYIVHPTGREVGWLPRALGRYDVSLALVTGDDVLIHQYDHTIDVTPDGTVLLQAVADVDPKDGAAPLSTVFDGSQSTGTDGLPILQYLWDTQSGPILRSATPQSSHEYDRPGGYTARLQIWDTLGYFAQDKVGVAVLDGTYWPPSASIIADRLEGSGSLTVSFGCDCVDPDGEVVTTVWQFGDGTTSAELAPEHTFSRPGTYAVRLTIEDMQGLLAYDSVTVTVRSENKVPPFARIETTSIDGHGPLVLELHANTEDRDGVVEYVEWTLPDGMVNSSDNIVISIPPGDYYTIQLQAVDNDGLSGFDERTIIVRQDDKRPPRIVSDPARLATTGAPYGYDADGAPSVQGDRPMVWSLGRVVGGSLLNVPEGMTVVPQTGVIQWQPKPEHEGEQRITLSVSNSVGTDVQDFVVTVRPAGAAGSGDGSAGGRSAAVSGGCSCRASQNQRVGPMALLVVLFLGLGRGVLRRQFARH